MIDFSRSIFEEKTLFSRPFLIKRDDLIHHYCNGNKARKFASLLDSQYANRIWVSYGGNQSNAMFALAYLARIQGSVFRYVMPEFRAQMAGNLEYALKWGMQAYTLPVGNPVSSLERCARENAGVDSQIVFIPQGGDVGLAMKGMNALAQELRARLGERPVVFYTSGSGVGVVSLKIALDSVFPLAELVVRDFGDLQDNLLTHLGNLNAQIQHNSVQLVELYRNMQNMLNENIEGNKLLQGEIKNTFVSLDESMSASMENFKENYDWFLRRVREMIGSKV